MILDVEQFVRNEQPHWEDLEAVLDRLAKDTALRMTLTETQRFYYLYRRAASDLSRLNTFASAPAVRGYLEGLTARAYAEIHETREKPHRLRPIIWFFQTFPSTFRRHIGAFYVVVAITLVGALFGAMAIAFDEENAKSVLLPFGHGQISPSERVAEEEGRGEDFALGRDHSAFAAFLMTNNIRVSIVALALGVT